MSQRVDVCGLPKSQKDGGVGKPSVNSAILSYASDPKPSELALRRVKFAERQMEARTVLPFNTFG